MTDDEPIAEPASSRTSNFLRSRREVALYISAIGTALFMLRLLGASWSTHFPAAWPDAVFPKQGYLAVAAKGPFRPSFYFAFRPIGYPLFLWLFGRDPLLTVVAQSALYCAVIIALCATALRVMRSRIVAIVTVVLFVGIAIQAKYALWSTQILSESVSMSLGFAAIAAWWLFAASPTRARARWGFALVIAFVVVRDANVLPTTIVIVPVALGAAWLGESLDGRVRRALIAGAVAVALVAGYSYFAQSASHRAELSFHDVIGVRVLPDTQLTNWFASHGMPLDSALRTRTGKGGLEDNFYISTDPAFAKYRHWARGAGPRTLVLSLFLLAPHYSDLMYKDLPSMLTANMQFYDTQNVYHRLPQQMPLQLGGPTTRKGLTIWLVLGGVAIALALALALWRRRRLGIVAFGATALVLTLVELYFTWGGDPIELQRHVIGALGRLSVILVIVVASAVDAAIDAVRGRPSSPEVPDVPEELAPEVPVDA